MSNQLLQKIIDWSLDQPETEEEYRFLSQLARENKWDQEYTKQVIQQYKRFLMLALNHQVAPSKQVDQAWHLHILRTENYQNMCLSINGRFLHHRPVYNKAAQEECRQIYRETLTLYEKEFNQKPDTSIWGAEHGTPCMPACHPGCHTCNVGDCRLKDVNQSEGRYVV